MKAMFAFMLTTQMKNNKENKLTYGERKTVR